MTKYDRTLPKHLITEIQNHTGSPWWNGKAYAEFKGYPGRIRELVGGIGAEIDEIYFVIEDLRQNGQYEQADRLRTIAGRLARLQPPLLDSGSTLIRDIARGWK